jgi:hypothetical protein
MQKYTAKPSKSSMKKKEKKLGVVRKGIALLHDNAKPHTTDKIRNFVRQFRLGSYRPTTLQP